MRRDANFSSIIFEIPRKSRKEERHDVTKEERQKKKIEAIPLLKLREKKLHLWQFNCQNMRGIVKRGILEI